MRKLFLNDLPQRGSSNQINWEKSIGYRVYFIYDELDGYIDIVDYNVKKKQLKIKYNENYFELDYRVFKQCGLSKILGKINSDFIFNIGTHFKNNDTDITIIDRKNIKGKYYRYLCNKCGYDGGKHWSMKDKKYKDELWVTEGNIKNGKGCSCCCPSPQIVVEGINDIPTTAPWMVKYFQGGYNEAKLYTKSSNQSIFPVCPDCGHIKDKMNTINKLYREGFSCPKCSDGISYPNKFMFNILKQLNINFKTEYSPKWCKYPFDNDMKQGRYDFYIPSIRLIIEMDGKQHKKEINIGNWRNIKIQKYIDNEKDRMASEHKIKLVRIDCEKSELEYIKQNIFKSELKDIFNLENVDWNKCHEFSINSRVNEACELWNNSHNIIEVASLMQLATSTVNRYLKQGNDFNIVNYDPKQSRRKIIIGFKDENNIHMFHSISECEKYSVDIFGIQLYNTYISSVCRGLTKSYKGYKFRFIKDLTQTEYIKYDIENKLKQLYNKQLRLAM